MVWNFLAFSELYTDSYKTTEFTDQFKGLNAVLKEFEVKDHIERLFLNVKMIDLNRTNLLLYKRLDEKNKNIKILGFGISKNSFSKSTVVNREFN